MKISGRIRIKTTKAGTQELLRITRWFVNLVVSSTNRGRNLLAQRLTGTNTYTLNLTHADIGRGYPAPAAPTVATGTAGVLTGAYTYKIAFVSADGETEGGTTSATINPSSQKVELTNIPLGATGITSRKIYRTIAGGAQHKLLATLSDNTTTVYSDNLADGTLGANALTASTAKGQAANNNDTQLQTASVRGAVTSQIASNNIATVQFFFSDAALANGAYSEFGTFVDGTGSLNSGQLFNRVIFGIVYNKATGEDTTVEVEFTIN